MDAERAGGRATPVRQRGETLERERDCLGKNFALISSQEKIIFPSRERDGRGKKCRQDSLLKSAFPGLEDHARATSRKEGQEFRKKMLGFGPFTKNGFKCDKDTERSRLFC